VKKEPRCRICYFVDQKRERNRSRLAVLQKETKQRILRVLSRPQYYRPQMPPVMRRTNKNTQQCTEQKEALRFPGKGR